MSGAYACVGQRRLIASAAAAVRDMLEHNPTVGKMIETPLFRDPTTGREITYAKAAALFKEMLGPLQ